MALLKKPSFFFEQIRHVENANKLIHFVFFICICTSTLAASAFCLRTHLNEYVDGQ